MKNSWKKTLSLLLCLVLLAGLFPAALAEGETCTLTFSVDGGNYLNPITAEKDSEITLPKAVWNDHYFLGWSREYNGDVDYQAGDTLVLTENTNLYAIWRDSQPLGLYAYWEDNGKTSGNTTVPLNGSITLTVEAGVSTGELSYEWRCYGMDPALLPGESSNIFTIDVVDKHYMVQCTVRDMEGNAIWMYYDISPDSGLWACSAGSGTDYENVSVAIGGSVTLTVEAGVDQGGLRYEWRRLDYPYTSYSDNDSKTLTLENVNERMTIWCDVYDDFGNNKSVQFNLSLDTGLWARAAGSGTNYESVSVPIGGSATLTAEAGVNIGELHCRWYRYLDSGSETLAQDVWTITVDNIEQGMSVYCSVTDDYGNSKNVRFQIRPDTGFWAHAAGTTDTYADFKVKKGESVTLTVEAGVDIGDLHYEWNSADLDPSLLPTDDSTASITIPSVEKHCYVSCEVSDDYGNTKYISFDVSTDTGLEAWVAGTKTQYVEYTVQKGGSVTLAVDARVDEGELRYCWESSQQNIRPLLPQDEKTSSFTLENLSQPCYIYCNVYDEEGNSQSVDFRIYTDTGLTAYVAGTQTNYMKYTVPSGESVTLAVDAHVNEGGLRYRWYCNGDSSPAGLPADESTTSFTLAKVEKAYEIRCSVYDDDGNYKTVFFDVFPDTGLKAWIEGTDQKSTYRSYQVQLGDSLTLSIKAETNGGNLHYKWDCFQGEAPGMPTDDQTASFTITEVKGYAYLRCRVSDDLGGRVDLYMEVNVDNGLRAVAAGTQINEAYYFDSSAPQTLTVEASANEGELTYQWYKREYGGRSVAVPGDGPSLFVGADTKGSEYQCEVTDMYGSSAYVWFYFRQGMAKELPFRTETAFESDPNTGEILVSFTPESTGSYTLKTASGDPEVWCYVSSLEYYIHVPGTVRMEAGKTYYYVLTGNENAFTLHLTMEKAGFRTFAELQALMETSASGERFYYEGSDDPFVIPEDLTIPANVSVLFEEVGVEIGANARLTVDDEGLLLCNELLVKGNVQNNGQISCTALSGGAKISYGEEGRTYLYLSPETEDELRSAVEQAAANTDPHVQFGIYIEKTDFTITRDLTIHSVTDLYIEKTLTVAPGVTLELSDSQDFVVYIYGDGQLRVQGTLRNNALIYLYETSSLVLEEGGVYSGDGIMQAPTDAGKAKDFFPWASLPEYSEYEIMADGYWYFLTKKIEAKPGDVNGDGSINSKDLILLRKLLTGLPADDAIVAPDVNGDGSFDIRDLVRLRKLLATQEAG